MISKRLLLATVVAFSSTAASAQGDDNYDRDRGPRRPHANHALQHTLGVQVNELFREIFNFNGNPSGGTPIPGQYPTRNPFMLTYDLLSRRTGLGFRAGVGYNYDQYETSGENERTYGENTSISARIGLQKAWRLGRKWQTAAGADLVWNRSAGLRTFENYQNLANPGDVSFNNFKDMSDMLGGGPMMWLRYNLTPRIQLGTEASFYYMGGDFDARRETGVRFADPATPDILNVESVEGERQTAVVSLPIAIFLLVRF